MVQRTEYNNRKQTWRYKVVLYDYIHIYTVTFNEPPSHGVIEKATWIECINYFCEMEMSAEVSKVTAMKQADDKLVETKNTVLVLPKMRL